MFGGYYLRTALVGAEPAAEVVEGALDVVGAGWSTGGLSWVGALPPLSEPPTVTVATTVLNFVLVVVTNTVCVPPLWNFNQQRAMRNQA